MIPAPHPKPEIEEERLRFLRECADNILHHGVWFDEQARRAAQLAQCSRGMISLIQEDQQVFCGRVGTSLQSTPRLQAFCGYCILNNKPMIVPDTTVDERFIRNPLVTGPAQIRFYAGFPLSIRKDLALGALCVIDRRPRTLTNRQIAALKRTAREVVDEILRRAPLEARRAARGGLRNWWLTRKSAA